MTEGVQYVVEADIRHAMSNFQSLATQLRGLGANVDDSRVSFMELSESLENTQGGAEGVEQGLGNIPSRAESAASGVDKLVDRLKTFLTVSAIIGTTKKVVDIFSSYENQMNAVEAVSGATAEEMQALGKQAQQLGADTNYSATQAGEAQEALLRLGNSAGETMEIVDDVMAFDRANKVGDLANSSNMLSSSLKMFSMNAEEATRVSDAMSMTTKSSKTDVAYLSSALNNAGADAKNFGNDIEDTLTLIAGMSNNFADGSSAGTALKGMFADLSNNVKLFEKQGVKVTDSAGNFRQVEDVVKDLNKVLSDKTPAKQQEILNSLFGETGKAAYNALSASVGSIGELENKIRDASGTTKTMAEIMDSGLGPKIDGMMGSAETLAIAIGEKLNPSFLMGVSAMTEMINKTSDAISNWGDFYSANSTMIDGVIILTGALLAYVGVTKAVATWQAIATAAQTSGTIANTVYSAAIGMSTAFSLAGGGATGILAAAQWGLNAAWAANPVGLVIAGIAGLIFGVRYAIKHFEWFREGISFVWELMKNSPIGILVGGIVDLMKHFEPLEKIIDKTGNAIKKLFGWKGEAQQNYDVKISNTTENKVKEAEKKGVTANIPAKIDEKSLAESAKQAEEFLKGVKIDATVKNTPKASTTVAKQPQSSTTQQTQQVKKDVKNDIKQTFTYHVSVTVNNEIDEEALAQKVASKTMADSKNAIINGFRLAGLE
ncbi:MAG: phage tail tape measure protein [Fusobacteriaceae bacterium]|nr:phage tail tape measure protein [Fusobacteriaceae bacterium]MBN2838036.1 phage tail tape measure protein [Fusobacteriaceae bacterium]